MSYCPATQAPCSLTACAGRCSLDGVSVFGTAMPPPVPSRSTDTAARSTDLPDEATLAAVAAAPRGPATVTDGPFLVPGSTDTAGDPNRWTAEVEPPLMAGDWAHLVAIDSERRDDEDDGREVFLLDSLDSAESLAAQINRPAPDPDLRSKIEGLLDEAYSRRGESGDKHRNWQGGRADAFGDVLALLDALGGAS